MKQIWGWMVGVVLVIAVGAFILFGQSNPVAAPVVTTTGGGTPTTTPQTPTPTSTPAKTGKYKDGTYTGPVTDAVYGQLQLKVTISGGAITDISWPIYPNGMGHTMMVNLASLPTLRQEALVSQSANVDIVSGATQTSEAFQQSLAGALAQAKA